MFGLLANIFLPAGDLMLFIMGTSATGRFPNVSDGSIHWLNIDLNARNEFERCGALHECKLQASRNLTNEFSDAPSIMYRSPETKYSKGTFKTLLKTCRGARASNYI